MWFCGPNFTPLQIPEMFWNSNSLQRKCFGTEHEGHMYLALQIVKFVNIFIGKT